MSKSRDIADSAATINYIDTVTSNVQSQIDNIDALPSQSGNAGKFLTTDGTTDSWGEVSASPTLEAVASGALANGDTVIINADGTVTAAGLVSTPVPIIGSQVEFEAGTTRYISAVYNTTDNKVIIAYQDASNSNKGTAVVGTIASGAITFGTPALFGTHAEYYHSMAYDANANKVVIAYYNQDLDDGIAVVGTVSGTNITFGSSYDRFSTNEVGRTAICYDSSANKLIIAYEVPGDNTIKVIVGTISGTSISYGSVASTAAPGGASIGLVYDANANKSLLCFRGASNYGYAAVISVSGTTPSIGTPTPFVSETVADPYAVYDSSNNKTLIVWRKTSTSYLAGIVATISGTSVTFGTEAILVAGGSFYLAASFDTAVNKAIVSFWDASASGTAGSIQATISGTSVTATSTVTYLSSSIQYNALVYDPDSARTIFAFGDGGDSYKGKALLYSSTTSATNLTSENYIGISDAAYSNGATATIQLVGTVDDSQSSLTAGQSYFVQENGSIALTPDTTPVFAGTAISATKLLIGDRDSYPNQANNSGKFLTTNGTAPSWTTIALNPAVGAIDAGGLCLTNTNGNGLISLSGASLASNNPQGYAGVGASFAANGTEYTSPYAAKYSTYYKRWFATGQGYAGQTSTNDLSLWTSVDGITWAVVTSLRFLYAATWTGNLMANNEYDAPFAIDESNGRIWVAGEGTTNQIKLAYFDPDSGNDEGTIVNIGTSSGSDNGRVCWIECLEPSNDIFIVFNNTQTNPKFAKISAGATSGSFLGNGGAAGQGYQKWRFCYNYDPSTQIYRVALQVGDSRQIFWRESTTAVGTLTGPVNFSTGASYDQNHQIMMSNTHLMWAKDTEIYYKSFAGDDWRDQGTWTTNSALSYSTKAMNYNPVDGNTYAITQRGQVHKFTNPASVSCIGTIGQGIADRGNARIKFRST